MNLKSYCNACFKLLTYISEIFPNTKTPKKIPAKYTDAATDCKALCPHTRSY